MHHKSGPEFALDITRDEINRAIREMIKQLQADPQRAKSLVLGFIRQQNERVDAGKISAEEVKGLLKPIRLAFELNEILVPWKKYGKLRRRGKTTERDGEYRLEEIRLLISKASLHVKVPILFMCSSGIRVGAFVTGGGRPLLSIYWNLLNGTVKPWEYEPTGNRLQCQLGFAYEWIRLRQNRQLHRCERDHQWFRCDELAPPK